MPMIIDNWPYSNLHNINLDWILEQIKAMSNKVENFELFFPHVSDWNNGEWDINHDYQMNEIVTNGNDIYCAKKNVPAGENINNTDYWLLVGTDSYIINKVDKSGDTMTGGLNTTSLRVYDGLNPMVTFAATDTGNISAAVIANTNDNALILRCTNGAGGHDDYALPPQSGTGYHAYKIVNTKEGVLALIEHTETITVAANTWTEINITQFYPPTGYHLLAMHLAGSTDYNARNNLYVMLNSLNNANRMLVYCSQALNNVDITLDAWFIRDEDYLTLTP